MLFKYDVITLFYITIFGVSILLIGCIYFFCFYNYGIRVVYKNKKESLNFFQRKKDEIILSLISGLLGTIIGAFLGAFFTFLFVAKK